MLYFLWYTRTINYLGVTKVTPEELVDIGPISSCYVFCWTAGNDRFRPVKNVDIPVECTTRCKLNDDDYLTYRQRMHKYEWDGKEFSIFSKVQTGVNVSYCLQNLRM